MKGGKSFSHVCLYLQQYFFFYTFTRLFLQLSLTIFLALISTNTFSNRSHYKSSALHSCNDHWPVPETAIRACHCYLLHHQFLTIRIDATYYVKARSDINFQIKTLEKYKISRSRTRSVFFLFREKKDSRAKLINFSKNWLIFKFKKLS